MENMEIVNKYMPDAIKSFGLNLNNYTPDCGWEYWHMFFDEVIPDIQKRIVNLHKSVEKYDNAIQKFEELRRIGNILSARANDFVNCASSTAVTSDGNTTILDFIKKDNEDFDFDKWFGVTLDIGDFTIKCCEKFISDGAEVRKNIDKNRCMENFLKSYINVIENFFVAMMCGYALEWSETKFKTKILRVAIQAFAACIRAYDDAQYHVKSIPVEEDIGLDSYNNFVGHIDNMHQIAVDCLRNLKVLQKTVKISGDMFWKGFSMKEMIHLKMDVMNNPIGMDVLR